MTTAYVVETIGELGACCAPCRGAIGDLDLPGGYAIPWRWPWEWAQDAANAAAAAAKTLPIPSLPRAPDPIPPALDVAGPSGWGEYVIPGAVVLVALGAAAVLLTKKKKKRAASTALRTRTT